MSYRRSIEQLRPARTTIQDLQEKVQILLTEGSTEAAKEAEFLLVHVAGGKLPPKKKRLLKPGKGFVGQITPFAKKNGFEDIKDKRTKKVISSAAEQLGKKILQNAGLSGSSGSMVDNQPVNKPTWKGDNTTPKTDIIIDRKKISLKKGSSQLMTGGIDESMSTFEVAASKTPGMKRQLDALAQECQDGINNLLPSTTGTQKGGKDDQVASGVFKKDKVLSAADTFHNDLKDKFRALFDSNKAFAKEFVFEAMTGKTKFNDNDGTATHFLVVDFDGSADFHKVSKSTDAYVSKILPKVKPDVKFKTTSIKKVIDGKETKTGYYRFWSVVGLGYKAAITQTEELMREVENGNIQYLSEGFMDKLKAIYDKVKDVISKAFTAIKNFLVSSAANFAKFLDLEPEISFTNKISW